MTHRQTNEIPAKVTCLDDLARLVDYSLMNNLRCDPDATKNGEDYAPRQVRSGHYVPVKPTAIAEPEYVAHSKTLFDELGFDEQLAHTEDFRRLFSGDTSQVPEPMSQLGWATGYALSIYGTEYRQQCPFQTGNGYGDGRAISVVEAVMKGQRWEMQLKGGGQTPYCRGADGRAVLRSSIREFLAQEHMHELGIPTTRSLCLFASQTETVDRPWYSEGSYSLDPDIRVSNPVAITTRVAPSFLRVGQIELFGRRARSNEHSNALEELEMIVSHVIEREYKYEISDDLSMPDKLLALANAFRERLTSLITHWLRVGYCQGNFNSDNCAVGGFTLDYGPFGFCEHFEPFYQPWTGGGRHFSFLNQPAAAEINFGMFCTALKPLLTSVPNALAELEAIRLGVADVMQEKMEAMWAAKLGLESFDADLFRQLLKLMIDTSVDYTIFFRELSHIPVDVSALSKSFYAEPSNELNAQWGEWLKHWRMLALENQDAETLSQMMKRVNPKYTWREWLVVPAYQQAMKGDYSLVQELQEVLTNPYDEQSPEVEAKYYCLRPQAFFQAGGVTHYSCSS
ncbi:YdiU family protein [Litoribrevibacter euphylliae]|uniref:Protein nucleotidyltransferase YdiU n=1 Tax=Litoribrevibacter euphylliae TaxID=1834034 RepID=A0ABV7HH05_9GAMM